MLSIGTTAVSQSFTNGDFETGDLSGWTITETPNGHTFYRDVVDFDIDFSGPLGLSRVARFQVAQVVYNPAGNLEGIELTQSVSLVRGVKYTISFSAATYVSEVGVSVGSPGDFDLIVEGESVANWVSPDGQSFSENWRILEGSFRPVTTGQYSIGARIRRGYLTPNCLFQKVDNFNIVPEPGTFVALGIGMAGLLAPRRRK